MSPKNVIKMINIQVLFGPLQSYSVHLGSFCPFRSYLVNISPIWPTSVLYVLTQSTSVLFDPHWSTLLYSIHFGSPCSHSGHFVLFGPFVSTSVRFCILAYKEKICLGLDWEYLFSIWIYFLKIYRSQTHNI